MGRVKYDFILSVGEGVKYLFTLPLPREVKYMLTIAREIP